MSFQQSKECAAVMRDKAAHTSTREADLPAGLPRAADAVVALIGLIVAAPFIALAALAIAMTSRGPIFFRQQRIGRHGRAFVLRKLRTMRPSTRGLQVTAGDDPRVTRVGKFLRKTKLDELPELWNILKGDMSLVGPRPETPGYVDLENPKWQFVLRARPGLTDPVTLRLRNEESLLAGVEENREQFYLTILQPFKLKGYIDYIQERSWRSDLLVLWKTALAIVFPSKSPPPTLEELVGLGQEHYRSV